MKKLVNDIAGDDTSLNEAEKYKKFQTLFAVPVLPSSMQTATKTKKKRQIQKFKPSPRQVGPRILSEFPLFPNLKFQNRSVRLECQLNRFARTEARSVLGTDFVKPIKTHQVQSPTRCRAPHQHHRKLHFS